jgi:hypothetical protein
MKELYILSLILLFGLGGCSSQKKLTEQTDFVVQSAKCYKLLQGREESKPQLMLEVEVNQIPEGAEGDYVFFRGEVKPYTFETVGGRSYLSARFSVNGPSKPDMVMEGDSQKEGGNQPPSLQPLLKEFPFELAEDEAVFRYKSGKKYVYFKVGGIVDGKTKTGI